MTKTEKILLPLVLLAAFGVSVLWIHEQKSSTTLARELQSTQSELEQVEAAKRGLETANDQLQARLNQVEEAAIALQSRPRLISQISEEEFDADGELLPVSFAQVPRPTPDPNQPTILSPEEQAAKDQEDAERAARQAEREQRREEFRQQVTEDIQTRMDFFSQINTEGLAPEYVEAHQKLMESLANVGTLMEEMSNPELSRDERREIGRELWGQSREMGEWMDMQRDVLLNDFAELSLGLSGEQTQQFIDYMQTVNKMTSGSPMRGGGRGR